jgi:hypothetical protein
MALHKAVTITANVGSHNEHEQPFDHFLLKVNK